MNKIRQFFSDGLLNFSANLGVSGRDKGTATHYSAPIFDYGQLSNLYRNSWSGRRVVDIPAGDMVREWRTWKEDNDLFIGEEKKFRLKKIVRESIVAGNKYGGAAIYIGVGDRDLEEPLNVDKIQRGQLEALVPLDRHELSPLSLETDALSPRYRRGNLYSINRGEGKQSRIHHSRFAWFYGNPIGNWERENNNGWDDSVYVGSETLIKNADVAIASLGHLILEAKIDVIRMKDLANHFVNEESEQRLRKRILAMNHFKSSINALLLDAEDEYSQKSTPLTGVADIAMKSLEALAGAADIPITRFLGQSPGGLNSSGDSDIRNYYDGISSKQESDLTPSLQPLDEVFCRHVTGKPLETIGYEWDPLWQMSKKEKTDISKTQAEVTKLHYDMGLLTPEFLAAAVLAQMKEEDTYPGIEQIEEEQDDVIELFTDPDEEEPGEPIIEPGGDEEKTETGEEEEGEDQTDPAELERGEDDEEGAK